MRTLLAAGVGLLTAAALASPAQAAPAPSGGCADVQVVAVRGTSEPGTVGVLKQVADRITDRAPQTVATYGLPYPATFDYVNSANAGITMLVERLARSAAACPEQRFVLLGWSQGAWVVGDALGGGGVPSRIAPDVLARVVAVVLYGDPRFTSGESWETGTHKAGVSGMIPRPPGALDAFKNRLVSFCDVTDTICQSGSKGQGHFGYWPKDDARAAAFVVHRLAAPVAVTPTATPTPAPTTPSPAAAPAPEHKGWFHRFADWLNPF